MSISDHPGFLGWTSRGVIAIHADWPAYAVEHGPGYAVLQLGQFPSGTRFTLLDDIDQCFLLLVGPVTGDLYADNRFHVALWHEDVRELLDLGYVSGASQISRREWAKIQATELAGLHYELADGTLVPVAPPNHDDFEDELGMRMLVDRDGLVLTDAGLAAAEQLLAGELGRLDEEIVRRSAPALQAHHYDSAVREACVVLESTMKSSIGSNHYGVELIDAYFAKATLSRRFISASLKTFRCEVRTAFKFVRNDYMHNLKEITATQCHAVLVRISSVLLGVREISRSMSE
jgi:hypothetical protein